MRLLVTGGAGFIGSNFVRHILEKHPDWHITNLDKLTYAGNSDNLRDLEGNPRHRFQQGDICDPALVDQLAGQGLDFIVNFAAESHVDRSILDPSPFLETNVKGTLILLEAARRYKIGGFLQISTDEVYGSLGEQGKFTEETPLAPNSPYAASKASADLMCRAYQHTHGLPVMITRCSNNFGPYQFPEKLIPLAVTNALENRPVPLYGDGLNVRDWLYVIDHCRAIEAVILKGKPGEVYNIGGNNEKTNREIIGSILDVMGKPRSLITMVPDRPGHDRRYAIDAEKARRTLGWRPIHSFDQALEQTVRWYSDNRWWWEKLKERARLRQ